MKGKNKVFRSTKPELKPKEDNTQKFDEETLDQIKYLQMENI